METSKSSRTAFVLLSAVTVILTVLFVSVVILLIKKPESRHESPSADATTEQKAEEVVDDGKSETTQELVFPDGTLSYNDHHYYIYNDDAGNWSEALEKCKERGGYLAVINDEEENEALFDYMVNNGFDGKGVAEPNNADSGEQYAELDIHMNGGHWNDGEFGRQTYTPEGDEYRNKYAYICEWEQ